MKMTQPIHEEPAKTEPVTLVEGRTLKPGHENDFYAWVQRAIAASERFPGNQGVTILTLGKDLSMRSPLVRRAIEAINQGNLADSMALFPPDATVVDVSTYSGHEAIRAWAQRETFNVQVRFYVAREKNEEGTIVEGNVQSVGGYSRPATFSFTLDGDRIQRLVIE
jgi:hypothetical protein